MHRDVPSPRVPPELIPGVIRNLHSDKPTLSACALVSQYWFELARPLLFRTITYSYHFERNPSNWPHPEHPSPLLPLAYFFESQAVLSSMVYNLELLMAGSGTTRDGLDIFVRILRCFPHLQSLKLAGIPFDPIYKNPRNAVSLPVIPHLGVLKIVHSGYRGDMYATQLGDIPYVLCLFGAVQSLVFGSRIGCNTLLSEWEWWQPEHSLPCPQIHSLELSDAFVLSGPTPIPGLENIRVLKLHVVDQDAHRPVSGCVRRFLNRNHESLQTLQFIINPVVPKFSDLDFIDFSPLRSLRSLVFPLPAWCGNSTDQRPSRRSGITGIHHTAYTSVVRAIATSPPSSLQTVVVELFLYDPSCHWVEFPLRGAQDLEELEDVCVHKALPTFEIRAGPGHVFSEHDRLQFKTALPILSERGVLQLL
ncbi:uncharacterized protein PHACADRAFT_181878 [Phanerochaete carnosa HHB-10118-sp]|uniref:F-box domain-containing protein n=1 Tax=Phanerochaete carnosa (strain HHB-10118-sp) TaxID=650164 RepID=K5WKM6_PHACS|nr:uncharacterized protein PHACADRAFT_181878 [Phanerochaete carnosa HHB-10118-sp]EKM59960.1 hypothetical protein PHACADRAFT_181878 [Phanerochaete carnosa HHB-10118-sp]